MASRVMSSRPDSCLWMRSPLPVAIPLVFRYPISRPFTGR
jgi:hypothetical protein